MASGTPEKRFWMKVDKTDSCWNWIATKNQFGYGIFYPSRKAPIVAHRFSYELLIGKIEAKLSLDHLCRNRSCVNPDHLEQVTHAENVRRGARTKNLCKHGIGETNCFDGCRSKYSKKKYLERLGK